MSVKQNHEPEATKAKDDLGFIDWAGERDLPTMKYSIDIDINLWPKN